MVEVGVRQLKSQLSYYIKLMEAGEVVCIRVRDRLVGYLTGTRPEQLKSRESASTAKKEREFLESLKRQGLIKSAKPSFRLLPMKPVTLTPGPPMEVLLRQMRDEE